jgi:hypothetical protein
MVLVEALQARPGRDAPLNQFISTSLIEDSVPVTLARRAAELRRRARKGSAVDALVMALAEPNGVVLTGDVGDLQALAAQSKQVAVIRV